jgi:hypothetical protein
MGLGLVGVLSQLRVGPGLGRNAYLPAAGLHPY